MTDVIVQTDVMQSLAEYIESAQGDLIVKKEILLGELCFTVRRESVHKFVNFLTNDANCDFKQLLDICGADYPERDERFDVVYHMMSLKHNHRIRFKIHTDEDTPVDSVSDLFACAVWYEREVWDMYGIYFNGNPDLRRILTDYGFEGHPLRKDFPLTGFVEVRYDDVQKRVVYEPVKLTQEYRNFDFVSPWEGMTTLQLPGDEKARKPKFADIFTDEEKKAV